MAEQHDAKLYFKYYRKIYLTLLALLVVSVAGPFFGIVWVTLLTAFGVALVKADMVIESFMHLPTEKRIVRWMLTSSLVVMALFFWGVAPDVMRHEGQNWVNVAAQAAVSRGIVEEHPDGEEAAAVEGETPATGGPDSPEPGAAAATASAFDAAGAYRSSCAACHGELGRGDGPVGAGLDPSPANFASGAFWESHTDEQLVRAIREGGVAVGKSPLMPPWGTLYDEPQVRAIVGHLKTLRTEG